MTDPPPTHDLTEPGITVEPHPGLGPAPDRDHFSTRRLVRWAVVLLAIVVGVVVCWHDNAYAHDGVVLTLHTDGRGAVWADVAWEDGHPVSESIAAALTAHSQAGTQVGPVALTALPGLGAVRYSGTLAAGRWRVVIDAAEPGTGTCTADFEVGTGAKPQSVTCERPPPFVAAPTPAAASGSGPGTRTFVFVGIGVAVLVAAGLALLMLRDRSPS